MLFENDPDCKSAPSSYQLSSVSISQLQYYEPCKPLVLRSVSYLGWSTIFKVLLR